MSINNNIHNFNKLAPTASVDENSRLFLILAISALLIGAEVLWSQIVNANRDIDGYSASIYPVLRNQDAIDAVQLHAEANVDVGDVERVFMEVDSAINSL